MISVDRFLNALEDLRSAAIQVEREVEEAVAAAATSAPAHGIQPIAIDTNAGGDGVFDTSSGRMVIASGDVEAWAWASKFHSHDYTTGKEGPWTSGWGHFTSADRIIEALKTAGQPFFFSNNNGAWKIEIIWTRVAGVWSAPFIMPPVGGFNSDGV